MRGSGVYMQQWQPAMQEAALFLRKTSRKHDNSVHYSKRLQFNGTCALAENNPSSEGRAWPSIF